MHDVEYHSAHAQMMWSQWFCKSESSLDTEKNNAVKLCIVIKLCRFIIA